MRLRQTGGSVVCRSCSLLVGVNDATCYHCGTPYPGLWGFGPTLRRLGSDLGFSKSVMVTCGVLYLVSLALDPSGIGGGGLFSLLAPSLKGSYVLGMSGAVPVFQLGRWWTVLSAGWLHGSLLHIAFNLMWVRQLAPVTAEIYGPGRTVVIYTASSAVGFSFSSPGWTLFRGDTVHRWSRFHPGGLGCHFWTARGPGLLGPARHSLADQSPGPDLRCHFVPLRVHDAPNR